MVIQQVGAKVSGTFIVEIAGQERGGSAAGSVSDTVLELDVDDSMSACTAHAHGTRVGTTVSGTLEMDDSCPIGFSGTFSLTKQ
jgi:hypothetical protein